MDIKNIVTNGYILELDGKYWGVVWSEYGSDFYGIVTDLEDAKIFKEDAKPTTNKHRKDEVHFVDNAKFKKVRETFIHKVEFV